MDFSIIENSPKVLRDFLTYSSTIRNKSSKSVEEYYRDLTTFFRYLKIKNGSVDRNAEFSEISIDDITSEILDKVTLQDLHSYLVYCKEVRGNNSTTRARKASTLRIFFKYLHTNVHLISTNPAELLETPKLKKSLPKHLTLEDCKLLLNAIEQSPTKERDYCIITLFLNCGMRLSELCAINLTDIKADKSLKILGKGNKERIIYLNDACMFAINEYLKVRPNTDLSADAKKALFISRNHSRISNKTVQYLVKKYLKIAGLDNLGLSTHKLRHTAATLMYQYGNVDIRVLKEILGHENLGTTQIYTHVADSQVQQALSNNPLADFKVETKN